MKTRIITDQEIVVMFSQSNQKEIAFEILMKKYRNKVVQTISRIVANFDDAEDLSQDVFIKIWQKLDYFRGESQLSTWIHRIATNEGLLFLRNKKKMTLVEVEEGENILSNSVTQYLTLSPEEIQEKLNIALGTLPNKQLSVFKMRYFNEMSYEQMAACTGTSVGALKATYHIGVKKLEALLNVA